MRQCFRDEYYRDTHSFRLKIPTRKSFPFVQPKGSDSIFRWIETVSIRWWNFNKTSIVLVINPNIVEIDGNRCDAIEIYAFWSFPTLSSSSSHFPYNRVFLILTNFLSFRKTWWYQTFWYFILRDTISLKTLKTSSACRSKSEIKVYKFEDRSRVGLADSCEGRAFQIFRKFVRDMKSK